MLYLAIVKPILLTLLLLFLLVLPVHADEPGLVVRLAGVYAKPDSTTALIGQLTPGSQVSVFQRQGGWKEVFSEDEELIGWVRSYQVREGTVVQQNESEDAGSDSRGFLAGLASISRQASRFFSGRSSSSSSSTATIGVRGLSEEEIESAKPDFEEFVRLKQYASNTERAEQFRLEGQLNAQQIEHLEPFVPEKKSSGGGSREK